MKNQYLPLKLISFDLKAAAVMLRDEASESSARKGWQSPLKPSPNKGGSLRCFVPQHDRAMLKLTKSQYLII
jgi:hypothetical protein